MEHIPGSDYSILEELKILSQMYESKDEEPSTPPVNKDYGKFGLLMLSILPFASGAAIADIGYTLVDVTNSTNSTKLGVTILAAITGLIGGYVAKREITENKKS